MPEVPCTMWTHMDTTMAYVDFFINFSIIDILSKLSVFTNYHPLQVLLVSNSVYR